MLRHTAYIDTLASIKDPTAPAWQTTVAGLVVLRLVDEWFDGDTTVVLNDAEGLKETETAINAIPKSNPLCVVLHEIINTLSRNHRVSIQTVAPSLFRYAYSLHSSGQWTLAKDVFATILKRAQDFDNLKIVSHAAHKVGLTARQLGQFDEAVSIYTLAEAAAIEAGDISRQLNIQLGGMYIVAQRGDIDLQDSYKTLSVLADQARRHNLQSVFADTLHGRADIRYLQGRYPEAIRLSNAALAYATSPLQKTSILSHLGTCITNLGDLSTGHDLHRAVLATTPSEWNRQTALLNLMEIAMWEKQEPSFYMYQRLLENRFMAPYIHAHYYLFLGNGYRVFGQRGKATLAHEEAERFANQYGIRLRF